MAERFRFCSFPERCGDRERRRGERERDLVGERFRFCSFPERGGDRERRRGEQERDLVGEWVRVRVSLTLDEDLSSGLTTLLAKPGLSGGGGGGAANIWRRDCKLAPDPEPETVLAKVMALPDLLERSTLEENKQYKQY